MILVLRHKLPRKGLGRLPPLEGLGFGSGGPLLQVDAFPNLVPGQGSNPRAYSDLVLTNHKPRALHLYHGGPQYVNIDNIHIII